MLTGLSSGCALQPPTISRYLGTNADLDLWTAARMSASFPYVTPVAQVRLANASGQAQAPPCRRAVTMTTTESPARSTGWNRYCGAAGKHQRPEVPARAAASIASVPAGVGHPRRPESGGWSALRRPGAHAHGTSIPPRPARATTANFSVTWTAGTPVSPPPPTTPVTCA